MEKKQPDIAYSSGRVTRFIREIRCMMRESHLKRERDAPPRSLSGNRGFTLIEVMIAIFLIVVALLGLISTTAMITKGNAFSKSMTTATALAQDRMEELTNRTFANITAGGPETVQAIYTREWWLDPPPADGVKMIVVRVTWPWQGVDHTVTLKNLVGS